MKKCKYLRVILTNRCNLSCFYCHEEGQKNNNGVHEVLNPKQIYEMVSILNKIGFEKIKLLGGEPAMRSDFAEIIYLLKKIPNIDLSMITNGYKLYENAELYKKVGIDRINISLNTLNKEKFYEAYGGNAELLEKIIKGICKVKQLGFKSKINFVYLRENESDLWEIIKFVKSKGLELNVLNLLTNAKNNSAKYAITSAELLDKFIDFGVKKISLRQMDNSLSMIRLQLKNGANVLIKHHTLSQYNFFNSCKDCKVKEYCSEGIFAIRLTEKGIIKPCLYREDINFDLKKEMQKSSKEKVLIKLKTYFKEI